MRTIFPCQPPVLHIHASLDVQEFYGFLGHDGDMGEIDHDVFYLFKWPKGREIDHQTIGSPEELFR
jgi:hypothetical protein